MATGGSSSGAVPKTTLLKSELSHIMCRKCNNVVYSQNLSGAKSKIYAINDKLSLELYDIVCIQETWWDTKITDEEIISNSRYIILSKDRSSKKGGGVAIIIKNSIQYDEIDIGIKTILEYTAVRLTIDDKHIIILNCYMDFLDLFFFTATTNLNVSLPSGVELIDKNNLHHKFNIVYS